MNLNQNVSLTIVKNKKGRKMQREEIINRLENIRESLKKLNENAQIPAVERYTFLSDLFCRLLLNHLDENRELWS